MKGDYSYQIGEWKRALDSGNALAVAGAGVTLSVTRQAETASWKGLLMHGVTRCMKLHIVTDERGKLLPERIEHGGLDCMLTVAESISNSLEAPGGGGFRTWLRVSIGSLKAKSPALVHALTGLGVPIAATNYDCPISEVAQVRTITWKEPSVIQRVLRGEEKGILHFHGRWRYPESILLGISSYNTHLRAECQQALQQAALALRSLVFIGRGDGMRDPNFGSTPSRPMHWPGKKVEAVVTALLKPGCKPFS